MPDGGGSSMTYVIECEECDDEQEFDNEEKALGYLFGHSMRTEHTEIEKREV